MEKQDKKPAFRSFVIKNSVEPSPKPISQVQPVTTIGNVIPFGADNLLPNKIAAFMRMSKIQRGISNDKWRHFTGSYFMSNDEAFLSWEKIAGYDESFFNVHKKLNKDKRYSGNAYLHIVTDKRKSFVKVQHLDFTKCRVNREKQVVVSPDWRYSTTKNTKVLPLFPNFTDVGFEDGLYHSAYHFYEYEAEFYWYGIPDWIAGWLNMQIDDKSDSWNLDHIDRGIKYDVAFTLPSGTTEPELDEFKKSTKDYKEGKPGSMLVGVGDGFKATVLNEKIMDLDWEKLNNQNIDKMIIANDWYKSLMSMSNSSGFDLNRIKLEYQLALTKILSEQEYFMEIYRKILTPFNIPTETLTIYNSPIIVKSKEERINEMLPFFTDAQKAEIGQRYFDLLMNDEN